MKKSYSRFALCGFMGFFLSIMLLAVLAFAGMPEKHAAATGEQTTGQEEGHQEPYWREQGTTKPERDVGNIIGDTIITAKIKAALLSHSTAQGLNLSVETSQGEVRLSGTVDTVEQERQAVTVARAVQGVKTVKNDISVKSCPEHEPC